MNMSIENNKTTEEISFEALELYKSGKFESQGAIIRHLSNLYPEANKERLRLALLRRVQRYKKKENHPALASECEAVGLPVENVSNYWYKGKQYSVHVKGDKQ